MTIDTVIFDLDGTISDPFVGISKSVNYALGSLGLAPVDPEIIRPLIGPPLTEIFEHLLGPVPAQDMRELIDKYRERYATIGYAENRIYDGIAEIIAQLSAEGFKLGICTAKRSDYAGKIVALFALDMHFSFIDGGDIGFSKTRQLARIVANGTDPARSLMIGDRAGDIVAAQANQLRSIGVLWGFGDKLELTHAGPDHLVSTPGQLQSLIKQNQL